VSHAPLPSEQHRFEGLGPLDERTLHWRREWVFLMLSGVFLGTLAMLNILGISRFIDLSFEVFGTEIPMPLAVGVLPYPVTFLCTDLISELYGRRRANSVVWMGLVLNLWVVLFLWLGGELPGTEPATYAEGVSSTDTWSAAREDPQAFFRVRELTFGAVAASMMAYLCAQFVDVQVFHWWKTKTKGKHLWLRNNGSTLVSQLVDTVSVILITHYYAHALPLEEGRSVGSQLFDFIAAGYVFKLLTALLDTGPFYLCVRGLTRYLRLSPPAVEASQNAA